MLPARLPAWPVSVRLVWSLHTLTPGALVLSEGARSRMMAQARAARPRWGIAGHSLEP